MFLVLNILWLFWELKYSLFWLYLWQLKEYHIGRLLDHFKTEKGKKLLFSPTQILKMAGFLLLFFVPEYFAYIFYFVFAVYLIDAGIFFNNILDRSAKKPVVTLKTALLTSILFIVLSIFFLHTLKFHDQTQVLWLLAFDILTPIIISAIVLLLQPFFVAGRNIILKKAKQKIKYIKAENNISVIAITGSYGKTSTKEFLATILSKKYKVLKTDKHQNSEIGVANCILKNLTLDHQIFIAEVGAYNKGKVKEVCSIINPEVGVVTGVNEQHLSLFGSMKNLLASEGGGELADSLFRAKKTGKENTTQPCLILNGDNEHCINLYKKTNVNKKVYTVLKNKIDSDIYTEGVSVKTDSISFLAINKGGEMANFNVNVLGGQNTQNLLAATLVAQHFGMNLAEISEACKYIEQNQAGIVFKKDKHGINIIDSSYSANSSGVMADLDYLKQFSGKKIIVMPCLIELGKKSAEVHYKIGQKIADVCDMAIITTKDKFSDIKKGATDAGLLQEKIVFCEKPEDIYAIITLLYKEGDVVLLEGRVPQKLINLLQQK